MADGPRSGRLRGALAVLLALGVPVGAAWLARDVTERLDAWLATPAPAPGELPRLFEVPRGQAASTIASRLEREGLVTNALALVAWLRLTGRADGLRAGEYLVESAPSPEEVATLLASGRVHLHAVTIPEGLTLEETATALAASGLWGAAELEEAFRDPAAVRELDPRAADLDGYLFPETYHFERGTPARRVAETLVARFQAVWASIDGSRLAAELGMSPREVVTLASLVEAETPLPQEYRLVSSVFHNRLERGMKLECDPTVIRALELDGIWDGGPLLIRQLSHDHPYNTYVYPGLPPGPICSPGEGALRAALRPAESRLLFFVASGDGGHRFAETAAGHARNVRRWRRVNRAP